VALVQRLVLAAAVGRFREQFGQRRLVRDQRPHLLGVPDGQLQRDRRAAAAGEDLRRFGGDRREQQVQVLGQGHRGDRRVGVRHRAAGDAARVVGHDGVVNRQQGHDRRETTRVHRYPCQQQDWAGAL
jgi:hypothetical protein